MIGNNSRDSLPSFSGFKVDTERVWNRSPRSSWNCLSTNYEIVCVRGNSIYCHLQWYVSCRTHISLLFYLVVYSASIKRCSLRPRNLERVFCRRRCLFLGKLWFRLLRRFQLRPEFFRFYFAWDVVIEKHNCNLPASHEKQQCWEYYRYLIRSDSVGTWHLKGNCGRNLECVFFT